MAPLAKAVAAHRDELLHDRQHRIADALGLALELGEVELGRDAVPDDFVGRLLRNNAEPCLRARKRSLDVEIVLHAVLVGKYPPHRLGGEDVAEDGGVDQCRGHGRVLLIRRCHHPPTGRPLAGPMISSGGTPLVLNSVLPLFCKNRTRELPRVHARCARGIARRHAVNRPWSCLEELRPLNFRKGYLFDSNEPIHAP